MTTRAGLLAMAAAAAAVGFAGSGASAPSATANPLKPILKQVSGRTLTKRETILAGLAAKEGGSLVWYTSLDKPISTKIVSAFEDKYSGLKVDLVRTTSEALDARIYSEASAGTSGADVIETNGPDMFFFQHKKNILIPYRSSPYSKGIVAKFRFDTWTADRINNFVVAWNTNLVHRGDEPHSLAELADPKWKGKISLEAADSDWFAAAYQYLEHKQLAKVHATSKAARAAAKAKIDRSLDTLFSKIASNAQVISGHITQANLLAAGQFAVTVSQYAHTIEAMQIQHAPVDFHPFVNPVYSRPQGIGIAYRLRHPATALLFYDWYLSKSGGQKVLLDNGSQPARPDLPDAQLQSSVRIPIDLRPIVAHWKYWSDKYQAILH